VLTLGDPAERWQVLDAGAPHAWAAQIGDGAPVEGTLDTLFLPSQEEPALAIYRRGAQWVAEGEHQDQDLLDGEVVDVGGKRYRVRLPAGDQTLVRTQALAAAPAVVSASMHVEVSPDEEQVRVSFRAEDWVQTLPDRAGNYLLLYLARAVSEDVAAQVPASEVGFRYADEVARELANSMTKLNLDVHRTRRAIEDLHFFRDPHSIIERRRLTGQIRLGTPRIFIQTLQGLGAEPSP